jgi:hypothetical protein
MADYRVFQSTMEDKIENTFTVAVGISIILKKKTALPFAFCALLQNFLYTIRMLTLSIKDLKRE